MAAGAGWEGLAVGITRGRASPRPRTNPALDTLSPAIPRSARSSAPGAFGPAGGGRSSGTGMSMMTIRREFPGRRERDERAPLSLPIVE